MQRKIYLSSTNVLQIYNLIKIQLSVLNTCLGAFVPLLRSAFIFLRSLRAFIFLRSLRAFIFLRSLRAFIFLLALGASHALIFYVPLFFHESYAGTPHTLSH